MLWEESVLSEKETVCEKTRAQYEDEEETTEAMDENERALLGSSSEDCSCGKEGVA